jgi:MFS family permease
MSVAGWFDGLAASASTSLTLEQVPELRGTMMSLFAAFAGVGAAVGAGIGGLALIFFDYERLGIILGSMGIIAAIIFKSLTVDPTRRTVTHKEHDAWRKELLSLNLNGDFASAPSSLLISAPSQLAKHLRYDECRAQCKCKTEFSNAHTCQN